MWQGRNDEAYKIYMTLERHPAAEVQKGAKRMLFGFRYATIIESKTLVSSNCRFQGIQARLCNLSERDSNSVITTRWQVTKNNYISRLIVYGVDKGLNKVPPHQHVRENWAMHPET